MINYTFMYRSLYITEVCLGLPAEDVEYGVNVIHGQSSVLLVRGLFTALEITVVDKRRMDGSRRYIG